jgi:hypothetical protein
VPDVTKEARLLLLWLVARKHGLVRHISALHDDALNFIVDIGNANTQLCALGYAKNSGAAFEPTDEGERYLREGF